MGKAQIFQSKIFQNFLTVGFIQALSMLMPLLTIPYLIKVLSPSGFGVISFALAYTTFFVVFTDYGYNLLGTRKIALHKESAGKVNSIFSTMLSAQILLTLIAVVLFIATIWLIPQFREEKTIFLATFGIVIGSTLLPTWYFQGIEHFKTLHWIQFGYRFLYTVLIFIFVNDKSDILLVPIFNSATSILGGLAGVALLIMYYKLKFHLAGFSKIKASLLEGWDLFVSAVSVTSIHQLPIVVLSFFASPALVGFYAFSEKILLLFRVVIQLLSTILYPRVIHKSKQSFEQVRIFISKVRKIGSTGFILLGVLLFFTPEILEMYFPSYFNQIVENLLKIWALLPLFIFLKITFQHILLTYNFNRSLARVMLYGAIINGLLLLSFTYIWDYSGTAVAVILTEVLLILALYKQIKKKTFT